MLNISVRVARTSWIRRLLVASCFAMLPLTNVTAQTTTDLTTAHTPPGIAPGAPAGSYPLSGFDTVNLYNGNLNFSLPLVEVRGRGQAQYTMKLPIEQRWRIERFQSCPDCTPVEYPVDAWWNGIPVGYGPGTLLGRRTAEDPTELDCATTAYGRTITRLTFVNPDGTEYELIDQQTGGGVFDVAYNCFPRTPDYGASRGTVFVTRDGTSATFISDTEIFDINYRSLGEQFYPTGYFVLRDGTRYRIEGGLVTWIRDRNGNKLQFTYDSYSRVSTIIDSLKRQITVTYYDFSANRPYDEISFKGFGGGARSIRVWYQDLGQILRSGNNLQTIQQLFPETQTPDNSTYNPKKVSSVELPNEMEYYFYYNSYGELALVQLPTGGNFEYDFGKAGASGTSVYNLMVYRRVVERRVYTGNWEEEGRTIYSIPSFFEPNTMVEVDHRGPGSNGALLAHEEHYFYGSPISAVALTPFNDPAWNDGKEFQVDAFDTDGVNKTALLRRLTQTWQNAAHPGGPRIIESVTTLADTNQVKKETTIDPATGLVSYDVYNNRTPVTY